MNFKLYTPAMLFLLLPAVFPAQAVPLLQVILSPEAGGGEWLMVHNSYSSPAEEYLVLDYQRNPTITNCKVSSRDTQGGCVMAASTLVELPHGSPVPGGSDDSAVALGGSARIGGLSHPSWVVSVRNIAVIYADGAMAGEPSVLNQMLYERRKNLQDAQQDLGMLERIEASPHPNWAKLEARFKRRAGMHDKQLDWAGPGGASAAPLYGHARDGICRQLAQAFHNAASSHRSPGPFPYLERYLQWVIQELQGPPLDATNGN